MKLLRKSFALLLAAGLFATAFSAPDATMDAARSGAIEEGRNLRAESQTHLRDVMHRRELARKENDVIKLNCVNEMMVQMKPHMNLLDEADANLPTTNEPAVTLASMQSSASSIRQLAERAAGCIGELDLGSESSNSFTRPQVPDDPFLATDPWGEAVIEAPAYASPFS